MWVSISDTPNIDLKILISAVCHASIPDLGIFCVFFSHYVSFLLKRILFSFPLLAPRPLQKTMMYFSLSFLGALHLRVPRAFFPVSIIFVFIAAHASGTESSCMCVFLSLLLNLLLYNSFVLGSSMLSKFSLSIVCAAHPPLSLRLTFNI